MGDVVRLPRHTYYQCDDDHGDVFGSSCPFCDGGLAMCTTCGGAEGDLPTHCPGEKMTDLRRRLVADRVIDYRWPKGWIVVNETGEEYCGC